MRTMTKLRRGVWGASVPGVRAMHKVSDVIVRGVKLRRGVGAAVVLGMLAGGCAKLPMTGPVVQGGEVSVRDGNLPAFLPREPAPDATPEAIVQGFLQAVQAGPGEGFRAARRFLSDGASRVWDPLANVRLYAQARPPLAPIGPTGDLSLLETAEVEVPFEQVASVDETGHYAVIGPETTSLRFAVTRDARGRWRISTAPEAIVLSDAEFALQFRQASVYFPDLAGRVLVPDVRYFPRAEAARGIVRAFAAGPPAWLADAVLRPLPAGSGEDLDPVSIDGSLVEVRLGGQAFLTAQAERDMVVACLTESLKTLPDVATVEVVVQGVQWNASGRGPQAVQVVNPSQDVFVLIEDESEEADGAAAADNPDDGGEAGSAEDGTEGGGASGGPEGGDGAEGAGEGGGASGGADGGDAGATAGTDAGTEDPEPEEEKGPTLGTLAVIEEGDLRVVPAFKDARFGDWSSLTIASDGRQVAGLGSDGAIWTVDPREAPVPLGGVVSAMAPVYDSHSWLWTVAGRSKSREVLAFPPGGSLSPPEESAV
ncbi:MAG: GerMN domain-containing protein, partial [Micrococcales bacterium]|nr:GerMN domain-containing protein [Micrococcales bacterium]